MRILIVDIYYPAFLTSFYAAHPDLQNADYATQHHALLEACFGTSDFYSRHLNALGCEAEELIVNSLPLQDAWVRENGTRYSRLLTQRVPPRLFQLPLLGSVLASLPGLTKIVVDQIKAFRPDVLYSQDPGFFSPKILAGLRRDVRLVVGQIASPLPPDDFVKAYDLILTSFPHFVPRLRAMGVASEYFRIGFDSRVLNKLGHVEKDIPVSFVGGISRHHTKAVPTLEYLAKSTPIKFFGYGAAALQPQSSIRKKHHGEVWGLDMYRALARSRITLNRHINTAENNANNMRLYEATGVGALLLTDRKDNLSALFDVGREVVAYDSPEEAVELINTYLEREDEAAAIARAGQVRTLREHSYQNRMRELLSILERYLGDKK